MSITFFGRPEPSVISCLFDLSFICG